MGLDRKWQKKQLAKLDPEYINGAVKAIRDNFPLDVINDLKSRIEEDPDDWLMGRKNIHCKYCEGSGYEPDNKVEWGAKDETDYTACFYCVGKGRRNEWPLHHGWGTNVRNFLRDKGFGERDWDIGNLDDYYSAIVELAVMGDDYYVS